MEAAELRVWATGLILAAVLGIPAPRRAAQSAATSAAPDVELRRPDHGPLRLSDLKGKVVLIDFWASWCAPCKASFPALDALYTRHHADGLEVLAVNVDEERRDAEAFLKERPHEMPVFFDPGGRAPAAFRVDGMPTSYLLDRQGRIRFQHVGYTSRVGSDYEREIDALLSEKASTK